ncbi:MAG: hypothetical protein WEB62_12035 [Bacteroidota bacterium]
MPTLKFVDFIFEDIQIKLPGFPTRYKPGRLRAEQKLEHQVSVYKSKEDQNKFAVRLKISAKPLRLSASTPRIFVHASIVGFFQKIDTAKTTRVLIKKHAVPLLYSKIVDTTKPFFDNAAVSGFYLPSTLTRK